MSVPSLPDQLQRKLDTLPEGPGVYLWKDAAGDVLYVGKAKSLQHRVRGYLSGDNAHVRLEELMARAADLDTILTDTEPEALLLEATLIRQHRPHFNTLLKDDKSFLYVKISVQEPFPRLSITRQVRHDGARYLGPYTDVKNLRRTLREIRRIFARPGTRNVSTMVFRLNGSPSPQLTTRLRQVVATVHPALRLETVEGVVETRNNAQKFLRLMATDDSVTGPINLGNPGEFTIRELAEIVVELTGSGSPIVHEALPQDDPVQRRPNIDKAKAVLGWEPKVALRDGLVPTIAYFDRLLSDGAKSGLAMEPSGKQRFRPIPA